VQVIEVMGRSAGWIAAGAALAKRRDDPSGAPHLIYLPEVAFSPEKFIADVQRVLQKEKYCVVVVGEGLVDDDGNYVSTDSASSDAFGHSQLGGAGEYLRKLVEESLQIKARSVKLGMAQRSATHCASAADNDEAFMAGQAAVQAAVNGETDKMVTLLRGDGENYQCETGLAPLSEIANGVKKLPESWINEDGVSMSFNFYKYALPLIQGEVEVPYENGVPVLAKLKCEKVERKLAPHTFE
jgi:6-phosphofructokinase 1